VQLAFFERGCLGKDVLPLGFAVAGRALLCASMKEYKKGPLQGGYRLS
jgi:hypothetical protein